MAATQQSVAESSQEGNFPTLTSHVTFPYLGTFPTTRNFPHPDFLGVSQFKVVTSAAEEEAKAKRDQFIRILGRALVDGFKPRMCIAPKINPDYTIEYTPDPIRMSPLSDEGQRCSSNLPYGIARTSNTPYDSFSMSIFDEGLKCLNTLEIWFLASMIVTVIVSLIALFRAWNHRHDFKKIILSRYKWFGIDHSGSSNTKHANIPRQSPEFAEPCECFNELG